VVALRAVTNNGVVGAASALVVRDTTGRDEFRLVTARHVVAHARANQATLHVEATRAISGSNTFPITAVPIPDNSWTLADDDDLATAPLPSISLPDDHYVGAIWLEQLTIATSNPTPDVQLVGRWGLRQDDNIVLTRRGILATPQKPTVPIMIGLDKEPQNKAMHLVDAFITPGMSGGAVFQYRPPDITLIGIISAHTKVPPPSEKWKSDPPPVQAVANAIWEAITPMKAGLVYVVPVARVYNFLWQTRSVD
jgi:hypothetical protein